MSDLVDFLRELLTSYFIPNHLLTFPIRDLHSIDLGYYGTSVKTEDMAAAFNEWVSAAVPATLYFLSGQQQLHHVMLKLPDTEQWLFCGPVQFEEVTEERMRNLFEQFGFSEDVYSDFYSYYDSIVVVSNPAYYKSLFTTFANRLYGETKYQIIYGDMNAVNE